MNPSDECTFSSHYQRFDDEISSNLSQENYRTSPKYGSILSCTSSDYQAKTSNENAIIPDSHQLTPRDVEIDDLTESAAFAKQTINDADTHWEMNYHEAAIFLEEGRNNEKFDSHPRHPEDLPAYLLVHNDWYYGLDLSTSLLLLALAFVEEPAVSLFQLPVWMHGSIELLALLTIGVELALKLRWIGWGTILKHKRTMLKCITLAIMFLEAVIVVIRQSSHFRVTRALRPIFLVDTKYCGGVRRFIRQILQTLPPILDMLGLLLFFIIIYMVLGYFMFSETNRNFTTLQDSFVSLFVLLTTAKIIECNYRKNMNPSNPILCNGQGILRRDNNFTETKPHNHSPNPDLSTREQIRKELKEAVASSNESLRKIFDDVMSRQAIPIAYALMESKSTEAYLEVLDEIFLMICPELSNFKSVAFHTDFELAERNAILKLFPNATIQFCMFHYCQAISKNFRKKTSLNKKSNKAQSEEDIKKINSIVESFMALAYLPGGNIAEIYDRIKNRIKDQDIKSKMQKFFTYFEKQWLKRIKPEQWSQATNKRKTNNPAESHNATVNIVIGRHPQPWFFIDKLITLHKRYYNQFISIKKNQVTQKIRPADKEKMNKLDELYRKLNVGLLSPLEFFDLTKNYINYTQKYKYEQNMKKNSESSESESEKSEVEETDRESDDEFRKLINYVENEDGTNYDDESFTLYIETEEDEIENYFPDVMMPSFSKSKWYAIYFVSYLSMMLYVMMNLMLAVVNETFTSAERDKFKKLFLHKRQACQHAFKLLVSKQNPDQMKFKQFEGLMRYYAPKKSMLDIILMFRHMNASNSGALSCEEFLMVYDVTTLEWEPQYSGIPWYHTAWKPLQMLCYGAHIAIRWPYFETFVYTTIILNGVAMVFRLLESSTDQVVSAHKFAADWDTLAFGGFFVTEALTKVLGLGIRQYLSSGWNLFDLGASVMSLVAACGLSLFPNATFFVIFRPLRLLRLFKIKKRYRDVFGTLVILSPLMCSTAIVMLILYYFFAIIGMEMFAGYDMRNCCINTTVEDFYKYSVNGSTTLGYYYLNTFDNLMASGMTLFELTVVNNWFILMNAYAVIVGFYTRFYFMTFYLVTMIVLTIVVSSFLEAFRFRIQYKRSTSKRDEEKMLHEEVELKWDELQSIIQDFQILEKLRSLLTISNTTSYIGSRPRTREVLQRRMYTHEIHEWIAEAKLDEKSNESEIINSFDDIRVEDSSIDTGQIIDIRDASQHHRNGLTTSPI